LRSVTVEGGCTATGDNTCLTVNIDVPTGKEFVLLSISGIGSTGADANDDYNLQTPFVLGDAAVGCDLAELAATAVTVTAFCSLGGVGGAPTNDITFTTLNGGTQENGDVIEIRVTMLVEGDAGTVNISIPV